MTLFFVLSGFVLGLSLQRSKEAFWLPTGQFVLRRVFRIYPALLVCTLLLYLFFQLNWQLGAPTWASAWFREVMPTPSPHDLSALGRNLLLADTSVNPITWTLQVEMLGSLLLPLIALAHRKGGWGTSVFLFAALLGVAAISTPPTQPWFFMFMFWMGYALSHVPSDRGTKLFSQRWTAIITFLSLVSLLGARLIHFSSFISYTLEALGATGLVATVLWGGSARAFGILDNPAVKFLGRISYSFYLVHFLALLATSATLLSVYLRIHPNAPAPLIGFLLASVSVAVTIPVSWFSHKYLELPMNELGRKLTAKKTAPTGNV